MIFYRPSQPFRMSDVTVKLGILRVFSNYLSSVCMFVLPAKYARCILYYFKPRKRENSAANFRFIYLPRGGRCVWTSLDERLSSTNYVAPRISCKMATTINHADSANIWGIASHEDDVTISCAWHGRKTSPAGTIRNIISSQAVVIR